MLKNKFNNSVSDQHEGTQPGGGIMFTSVTGEGTDRGPKRAFVDASPESIDLLVGTIGQSISTLEAKKRAEHVVEAVERMIVGSIGAGSNAADLIEKMKDDGTTNAKPQPVKQTVLSPSRGVIRDPKTKQVRGYDVKTVDSIPSNNSDTPDTIRTTKYKKPNR